MQPGIRPINAITDIVKKHPRYASVLGVIVAYGLLGFFLAPYLLQQTLVETMQREFGAELRVEKIEINPFALSLRITGLELDNPDGQPTARIGEAFANFQLSSLFRWTLTFAEIRVSSPRLHAARDASGGFDFSYLLEAGGDAAAAEAPPPGDGPNLLPILVYNFAIEDAFVNWSDRVPLEAVQTRVGPISIEIEELNTIPDRSGQQSVVIATPNDGRLSWSGDLQLNPLRTSGRAQFEDLRFPLISAYIRHQAGIEIVDGAASFALDYAVETAGDGSISAAIENLSLTVTDIAIDSFADGTGFDFAGGNSRILSLPTIRVSDGRFAWPEQTLSFGSVSIDDPRLELTRDEAGVFNLEPRQTADPTDAGPPGDPPASAATDPASPWRISIGELSVNGLALNLLDRSVTPAAKLGISDFNLRIDDISNQPGKRFPTRLDLQLLSGGSLALAGGVTLLPEPAFDFEVDLDALQLAAAQPYVRQFVNLNLDSGAINLAARVSGTAAEPLALDGNLRIVDLVVGESIDDERVLAWNSFAADKIALRLSRRELDVSRIRFEGLYGDIRIGEDGSLNIGKVKRVETVTDEAVAVVPESDTESESAKPPFAVRIGEIVLADASADFADLSLPLPFAVKIDALNGKVTTISTASSEASEVDFEGKVDEYGFARISGRVTPLQPAQNTDLVLSFENIDLPGFTPYSIPFAGREVKSGKLDLKLGYQVNDGRLVGENSIVLRDFELGKEVPHPDALDIPLGLAVALLKDANGKIDIDLPVRGDVNDPEFSYGGVIMSALGDLLVKIVLSPFAALGNLLGIEASELEQIKFLAGRADLTPPEQEQAAKLAEALALRPELGLVFNGIYDAQADRRALATARLDATLEARVEELEAGSDASLQYADLRRKALEQLYTERLAAGSAGKTLETLQTEYTTPVETEGQAEPVPTLDRLAYANTLRGLLIELQEIDVGELTALARARAESVKAALIAIDPSLQERVTPGDEVQIEDDGEEPILMKVTLTASG